MSFGVLALHGSNIRVMLSHLAWGADFNMGGDFSSIKLKRVGEKPEDSVRDHRKKRENEEKQEN